MRSVSYRRASVKLGSSDVVWSRKHKSRVVFVIPSACVGSDVGGWGSVSSTGDEGPRVVPRQYTLRYVEWLIRWNNRLSSAASDGTDGWGGRPGVADWETATMGWDGEIPMHYLSAFLYLCLRPPVCTSVLLSGSRDATRCNRQDGSLLLRSLLMTTIIIRKSTFPSRVSLRRYGCSRSPRSRT